MISLRVHERNGDVVVAACDYDILGEEYCEGKLVLSVPRSFYGDESVSMDTLNDFLPKATIANLSGNRVVEHAMELGYIERDSILEVGGIKHAQLILI